MTISLPTLRSEVRFGLALSTDETDLTNSEVDLLLNRTYWELCEKFHIRETESASTLTTEAGVREYQLPSSFESLRISAIVDPNTKQHTPLRNMSIKEYETVYNSTESEQAIPERYFRGQESLILWPTPDAEYQIVIHYRSQLENLAEDEPNPALPRSWQELLIQGAIYRGFIRFGDYDKGKAAKSEYYGTLNTMVPQEAKEEYDTSKSGLQPLGMRDYP